MDYFYQEELNQFKRNQVWELVDRPNNHPIIRTKWVFRNKVDEHGIVIRNKARLVAKIIQSKNLNTPKTFFYFCGMWRPI